MHSTRHYLKTYTVDQLKMPWTSRGGRFWSLAEIHAPFMFLLSGGEQYRAISFVAADPLDLASMWRDFPLGEPILEWFETNPSAAGARVMRRVSQVLRSQSGKALVVSFTAGDTFKVGSISDGEAMNVIFPFAKRSKPERTSARSPM